MPCRSRPLFLVPSLMTRPIVEGVLVDLGAGTAPARVDGPVVETATGLRGQLEPLIVELNLAGYEVVTIAASSGPNGSARCYFDSVQTGLLAPDQLTWDATVQGPAVAWSGTSAALALQIVPRLAMREEVGGGGSVLPSSYGIPFATPDRWTGTVDANTGGWLATTIADPIGPTPLAYLDVAGDATKDGTPAHQLREAVRSAATARWEANAPASNGSWSTTARGQCGLAPLFDPRAWAIPPGDEGVVQVADLIQTHLWAAGTPDYHDLVEYTLTELLEIRIHAGARPHVEDARAHLRSELLRREVVDPSVLDAATFTERRLGPRILALFAEVESFGKRPLPVDLFLLLELGLVSLDRRVADEECLPAVIAREWSHPTVTGRYDEVVTPLGIPVGDLGEAATAGGWHDLVAGQSNAIAVNQAGDHIEGFWQERLFTPAPTGAGPVTFQTWKFGGDRVGTSNRFDVSYETDGASGTGSLTFSADGRDVEPEWVGDLWSFRRAPEYSRLASSPNDRLEVPPTELVTPFMNDVQISAYVAELEPFVHARERCWLSTSEIELLAALVERVRFDLEWIASVDDGGLVEALYLCEHLSAGFAYFFHDGVGSEHLLLARHYVKERLLAMPGDGSPLDPINGLPPQTYWHALADALDGVACAIVNDGLGLTATDMATLTRNVYRWRFVSDFENATVQMLAERTGLKDVASTAVKAVINKAAKALSLVDDIEFGIAPDPQFDLIAAEIQKIDEQEDPIWTAQYVGVLAGMGVSASIGMNVTYESEWSTIDTLNVDWTPDDFAGPLVFAGLNWGITFFGLELPTEALMQWVWTGNEWMQDFRTSGEISVIQFISAGKEDVWTPVWLGFTNSWGAFAGVGASVTGGYLWLVEDDGEQPVPDPAKVLEPIVSQEPAVESDGRISFAVGRSELTEEGAALLRKVAAIHLHELSAPGTTLQIVGHASPDDARALYNQTLSERRAANVLRYLKAYLGPLFCVQPQRTRLEGLGQQESELHSGDDPSVWRRVDVLVNGRVGVSMVAL